MSDIVVFDIETYRPDWQIRRMRREDLDPERNIIITTGIFDGEKISISPIVENPKAEGNSVSFFLRKIETFENPIFVGYNILRFDIPYLIHKSKSIGKVFNRIRFRPLDLYWIMPYWLHNTSTGKEFFDKSSYLGNLWKFEYVVEHILEKEPNPFSNKDIPKLWEMKRFDDIRKHLELDLIHTFQFYDSWIIKEVLKNLQKQNLNKSHCLERCPYRQLLQKTSDTASYYCVLLRETTTDERTISAIDVIDYPLPEWDISWLPQCLK